MNEPKPRHDAELEFSVSLPDWAIVENRRLPERFADPLDRMRAVIRFSRVNFEQGTGGPFAAGVFEKQTGRLVVVGVNRVVPSHNSSAHAEIVTLSLAQQILGSFDLGGPDMPAYELVVNARPCAMCFGAIPWSGVRGLVVAVPGDRIEELTGFDEGPIHPNWQQELQVRGIEVTENVLVEEAAAVLRDFGQSDQEVYNGRRG